jgi:hypothetical protein
VTVKSAVGSTCVVTELMLSSVSGSFSSGGITDTTFVSDPVVLGIRVKVTVVVS